MEHPTAEEPQQGESISWDLAARPELWVLNSQVVGPCCKLIRHVPQPQQQHRHYHRQHNLPTALSPVLADVLRPRLDEARQGDKIPWHAAGPEVGIHMTKHWFSGNANYTGL